MKKLINMLGNIMFYTVLIFLLLITLIMGRASKTEQAPSFLGYKVYNVLTGSMSPTIKVGGLIIVKEVSPQNIQEGDVITFRSSSTDNVTTHRVIDIENVNGIKFVTKGDANNVQDPNPIDSSFLVGKVVKFIPYLGAVAIFIQKNMLLMIGGLIIIFVIFMLITKITKVQTRNKKLKIVD